MDKKTLQKQFKVLWIIWLAMFGALFIYGLLGHLMRDAVDSTARPDFPLERMHYILIAISIAALLGIRVVRKRLIKASAGMSMDALIRRYVTVSVISFAAAESIGVFGLVLFFLGDEIHIFYMLLGVAAVALINFKPRFGKLEELIRHEEKL